MYVYKDCDSKQHHGVHMWREKWWKLKRKCTGYYLSPWLRANPSIGTRTQFQIPLHSKHTLRLTRTLVTPQGVSVDRNNVYLQCEDPQCWHVYWANRKELYREMLLPQVNQTWPG